ncbi:hypothetical protein AB0P21_07610 [Kribbella sp. NPDC056861]|uniref:hypothetical protein n=1 Tax=Kribbella sp. NPDC056861 TaxID=3154857 RepID=UPI0034463577
MRRLVGWIVLGLIASILVPLPATPTVTAVTELPGGKANWVVSVGGLNNSSVNNYANWTRLGWYIFATDGTVRTSWWSWNQLDKPMRVDAMTASCGGNVPTCAVQTMDSFLKAPTGAFEGTYQTSAGKLEVSWTKSNSGQTFNPPLTERWNLDAIPGGKVARISSDEFHGPVPEVLTPPANFSTYTAKFGIGYGSNAPLSAANKASITDIRTEYGQAEFVGRYVVANRDTVQRQASGLRFVGYDQWRSCPSGKCVGYRQTGVESCAASCMAPWKSTDRMRYLADAPPARNNIYTYWCVCLAKDEPCYKANNHVQSLLQVIDDDRKLQGWVGVETSTSVDSDGLKPDNRLFNAYWGILDMVTPTLRGPG